MQPCLSTNLRVSLIFKCRNGSRGAIPLQTLPQTFKSSARNHKIVRWRGRKSTIKRGVYKDKEIGVSPPHIKSLATTCREHLRNWMRDTPVTPVVKSLCTLPVTRPIL